MRERCTECASRYLYLHGRSLRLTVEPDPHHARGVVAVRYARETGTAVSPQGTDLALGFIHRALLSLADGRYGLRSVELPPEGTTFAAVLDEVRRDAAWRYLTATDLPMNQIAGLLGLSEQSALTRCCRRWWQQSPQPYDARRPSSALRRRSVGNGQNA